MGAGVNRSVHVPPSLLAHASASQHASARTKRLDSARDFTRLSCFASLNLSMQFATTERSNRSAL